jgi:carboxyl-terminal processing protease
MRSRLAAVTASACALILLVGVITLSYEWGAATGGGSATARPSATATATTDDIGVVSELFERIRSEAVDVPEDAVLIEGALEGMLETLEDPYALYYDAADFARFNRGLDGSFFGVGLLLEESSEGDATVVRALPDTPAERAGIEAGEIIVSVDGEDVRDLPLSGIVEIVTGEEGTPVVLGLEGGPEGAREVELIRAEIQAPTVDAELLEDGAGLIQLISFSQNAAEQLEESVEELLAEGAEGIILDLRRNPGGLLDEAVDVASVFVDGELIVSVREADRADRELSARSGGFVDVPLVILVDEFSASASEIVAGAMQDIGRAEVVGETTFGKGTVQTVRPLSAGGGVKFTTAEYLTPSGASIEGVGVVPDTVIDGDEDAQLAAAQEALRRSIAALAGR